VLAGSLTKLQPLHCPADQVLKLSTLIEHGVLDIYKLPLVATHCSVGDGVYKYAIGNPPTSAMAKPERVLLLVGATGSGKTTIIHGLANYLFGVKFSDRFRFKVVPSKGRGGQVNSHTDNINVYTFYSTMLDYTLTVIDTPGFIETDGDIERNKNIVKQFQKLFKEPGNGGIDVVHGIAFVTPASIARLTPSQKLIFYTALSIFGKDISDNLFLFATFADTTNPLVQDALNAANLPFPHCFKFNNSALFAKLDSEESQFGSMFWEFGMKSFANVFLHFGKVNSTSLTLTREVLKVREQIESFTAGLHLKVKMGLSTMDVIKQEEEAMKTCQQSITENKDFQYEITVQKVRIIELHGTVTCTCMCCFFSCHNNCALADNREIELCYGMSEGYCTVCPNRCHWTDHIFALYRIEHYTETEVKTYDMKKELYDRAIDAKKKVNDFITIQSKELDTLQSEVYSLVVECQKRCKELKEIALMTSPLTEAHIKLLISSEEADQRSGWKERVNYYRILQKKAEILKKAADLEIKDSGNRNIFEYFML